MTRTPAPQLNSNDLELLSAYIDRQLPDDTRIALERRLEREPELRRELDELQATVAALRSLEPVRPPRSFTLDPAAVAPRRQSWLGRFALPVGGLLTLLVAVAWVLGSAGRAGAPPMAAQVAAAPTAEYAAPAAAPAPAGAPAATANESAADSAARSVAPAQEPAATAAAAPTERVPAPAAVAPMQPLLTQGPPEDASGTSATPALVPTTAAAAEAPANPSTMSGAGGAAPTSAPAGEATAAPAADQPTQQAIAQPAPAAAAPSPTPAVLSAVTSDSAAPILGTPPGVSTPAISSPGTTTLGEGTPAAGRQPPIWLLVGAPIVLAAVAAAVLMRRRR